MKTILLIAALFVLCVSSISGQGKLLATDPLTNLPLIPATDSGKRVNLGNIPYNYNEPSPLPSSQVCKSKLQGDFYTLYNIKVDAVVAWYASHLTGFKKVAGYNSGRSQTAFYNADGTIVVIVTGTPGASGANTDAYSVAYQRYQPGISEKTVTSMTQAKIACP